MDVFPGNVLVEGAQVLALIDFGPLALVGDRRMDPLTAAIYLESAFSETASHADRAVASDWIAERGLRDLFVPARRWLAAFWSAATWDDRLAGWSRSVLLG